MGGGAGEQGHIQHQYESSFGFGFLRSLSALFLPSDEEIFSVAIPDAEDIMRWIVVAARAKAKPLVV